jgi:hypothetical protein
MLFGSGGTRDIAPSVSVTRREALRDVESGPQEPLPGFTSVSNFWSWIVTIVVKVKVDTSVTTGEDLKSGKGSPEFETIFV